MIDPNKHEGHTIELFFPLHKRKAVDEAMNRHTNKIVQLITWHTEPFAMTGCLLVIYSSSTDCIVKALCIALDAAGVKDALPYTKKSKKI